MIVFVFGLPGSGKSTFIDEFFPDFKKIGIRRFQHKQLAVSPKKRGYSKC